MSDVQQARFEGWAIVDVLGHQRYVGYVTTEAYGQAVLFRVDVPALEERTRVTKQPGYITERGYCPAGTTVKEGAVAGYTKLIGSGSIYSITPCTQEAALEAVENAQARPLMEVQLPPERALAESDDHSCPVCHSTAAPCECEMAEAADDDSDEDDDRVDFDEIDGADEADSEQADETPETAAASDPHVPDTGNPTTREKDS